MNAEPSSPLLLTPGPLTTTASVKAAMMRDISTWDPEYFEICQSIRARLVALAVEARMARSRYTTVLVQGSGTFAVEATLGTVVPPDGKLLVASNGAYGRRMIEIARRLRIAHSELPHNDTEQVDPARLEAALAEDPDVTHVGLVHLETTTGILNDVETLSRLIRRFDKRLVLDSMSAFGGVPFDMEDTEVDFMISSANKCIQGVPGFAFVVARSDQLEAAVGWARSLVLDLHHQWLEMDAKQGKWRYTSPTHTVLAFDRALDELDEEGGVEARHRRFCENQRVLLEGLTELGFRPLLPEPLRSPVITSFHEPDDPRFVFEQFFAELKAKGFMIYPGKLSQIPTFRIGSIGDVSPADMSDFVEAVHSVKASMGFTA